MSASDRDDPTYSRDAITGLPQRAEFLAEVDRRIAEAGPKARRDLSMGVLSTQTVAYVSAAMGLDAGDRLLREIIDRLRTHYELPLDGSWRDSNTVMGHVSQGHLAVFSGLRPKAVERGLLGGTLRSLGAPIFARYRAGVAAYHAPDDATESLRKAQLALVHAWETPDSDLEFYTDELDQLAERRATLHQGLATEIERMQSLEPGAREGSHFALHYQPKVELGSGRVIGAEALVRWNLGGDEPVSPVEFIPVAEQSELIVPLGAWILETACNQARAWGARGLDVPVAVNVSPVQFGKTDFFAVVEAALERSGLAPQGLELEVTEGAVMADGNEALELLERLQARGIELAIDDFGTGYSSLAYLKNLPVQRLKIDQSFVRALLENARDKAIVKAVIAIAHNLDLKVIAEGVETAEHAAFLEREGCGEGQGYHFARPLDATAFEEFARTTGTA